MQFLYHNATTVDGIRNYCVIPYIHFSLYGSWQHFLYFSKQKEKEQNKPYKKELLLYLSRTSFIFAIKYRYRAKKDSVFCCLGFWRHTIFFLSLIRSDLITVVRGEQGHKATSMMLLRCLIYRVFRLKNYKSKMLLLRNGVYLTSCWQSQNAFERQ